MQVVELIRHSTRYLLCLPLTIVLYNIYYVILYAHRGVERALYPKPSVEKLERIWMRMLSCWTAKNYKVDILYIYVYILCIKEM